MAEKNSGFLQTQGSGKVKVFVQKAPILSPITGEVEVGSTYREIFNSYKGLSESHTVIYYKGEQVTDWDEKPYEDGVVSINQTPQGSILVAAIVSIVVGAAIGYLMYEEPPEVPQGEKARRVRGDKNGNKGYEPLPFILGRRKVIPAYAAKPYTEYIGTDQYYNMLLHIGYGPLRVSDIKIGSVPINSFADVEYEVLDWYQNSSPSALQRVWSQSVNQNSVNQEVPRVDDFLTTNIPVGRGRTTVVINYPQGLRWIGGSGPKTLCGSVQVQYRDANGTWLTPVYYNSGTTSQIRGVVPYGIYKHTNLSNRLMRAGSTGQNWGSGDDNISAAQPVPSSYIVYDDGNGFAILASPDNYRVGCIRSYERTANAFTKSTSFDQTLYGNVDTENPVPFRIRNNSPGDNSKKPWTDRVDLLTVSRSEAIQQQDFDDVVGSPSGNVRQAVLALRIRASDQISGTLDDVNVIAESVVPSNYSDDWRFWYTNNLALQVSNNPADLYRWVLQGPMNPVRVANERVDIPTLQDWRQTCVNEGWETSSLVNYEGTLKDTLSSVARTGRAQFSMRDGKFSVVENILRTVPSQVFTNKNSRDFTSKRVFPDPSDGITVEFQNENEDFEVDEFTYYDPSIDYQNYVFQTDSLELWGVSNPILAQKHARFAFFERKLRREVYTLKTDIESLSCQRGSFVKIANTVIDVGIGQGLVKEVNGNQFTIDETFGLTLNNTYGITVRSVNGGVNVDTITAQYLGGGLWETSSAINFDAGDLAAYGEVGNETLDCIVTEISYSTDYEATITLVNAANEIYTTDGDVLPPYETALTPRAEYFPPATPVITVDEGVSGYNNPVVRVVVTSPERIEGNIIGYKLQYRINDEVYEPIDPDNPGNGIPVDDESALVWTDVGVKPPSDPIFYVPITSETGTTFIFRAKAYGGGSLVSDWSEEYTVTVSEKPAPDVVDFQIEELVDTPKTPDGMYSTFRITVDEPNDTSYQYSILEYRTPSALPNDPDAPWFFITNIGWEFSGEGEVTVLANGTQYEFRVRSVSIWGIPNKNGVRKVVTTTNTQDPEYTDENPFDVLPVPNIRGLELFEQGNDTEFSGRDAKFSWRKSSVRDWVDLGYEGLRGAGASRLDQYFRDYQVEIWADNNPIRTEFVLDNSYTYTFEKNAEDYERENGELGAYRDFEIRILQRGRNNQVSQSYAKLAVSNTPPKPLQDLSIIAGFNVIEISYTKPVDRDFAGVDIWVETLQGFNPDTTQPFKTISDNSFTAGGLEDDTTYYVRLRPFDDFGRTDTNTSSEFVVTTKATVDITGLSGWAYEIDPVDRQFIEDNLAGEAIPSTKIENLTAAKLTAGVINATETITTEGVVRAVDDINNPQIQTGLGPVNFGTTTTYLMWAYNGQEVTFGVDELGNVQVTGAITIAAGSSGVAQLSDAGALATKDQAGSGDVSFNYAGSSSKGGSAIDTEFVNGVAVTQITSDISSALSTAQTAKDTADGKIRSFYQDNEPAGLTPEDSGDLWIDTNDSNKLYRWSGSAWVPARDDGISAALQAAQDAETAVGTKITTFFQSVEPTANIAGDLWFNTTTEVLKVWDGSVWKGVGAEGADWNSTLSGIPDRISDTATVGLNITDEYIGYYNGVTFKTYIQNDGSFHFGSDNDNFIDYNGTQLVIETDNFSVDPTGNATFSGELVGASGVFGDKTSGRYFEFDGLNLIAETPFLSFGTQSAVFGNETSGQYIKYEAGVFEVGPNASIGSNVNRTVTVGSGGDFSTLNSALEYLSRTVPAYKNGGFTATVQILTGTVISESLSISGVNLGWIEITHQDGWNTPVSINANSMDTFITVTNSGVSPRINFPINISSGSVITLFDVLNNSRLTYNSENVITLSGARISSSLDSTFCFRARRGSTIESGQVEFLGFDTQFRAEDASTISCERPRMENGRSLFYATGSSTMNLPSATALEVSNAVGECRHGSTANVRNLFARGKAGTGVTGLVSNYGSSIDASFSTIRDMAYDPMRADFGGFISAYQADTRDLNSTFFSGIEGFSVSRGGTIAAPLGEGTFSQAVNTITSQGIIFH